MGRSESLIYIYILQIFYVLVVRDIEIYCTILYYREMRQQNGPNYMKYYDTRGTRRPQEFAIFLLLTQ